MIQIPEEHSSAINIIDISTTKFPPKHEHILVKQLTKFTQSVLLNARLHKSVSIFGVERRSGKLLGVVLGWWIWWLEMSWLAWVPISACSIYREV